MATHDQELRVMSDEARFEPDPVIDTYKHDLDRTLVREQLRRTPDERVRNMIAALGFAEALRRAGRDGGRRD